MSYDLINAFGSFKTEVGEGGITCSEFVPAIPAALKIELHFVFIGAQYVEAPGPP